MKNSSKDKQNMGIYIRKQGQNKVNSCHGLLTLKKVGRFLGLEYNMLHSIAMRGKSLELKKIRESTALLTRKVQEFCNRQLVSSVSDFGTKKLWSQHFVKRSFHYHCLDLKYIAPKRFVTNKYMTLGWTYTASWIWFPLMRPFWREDFVTSLSAVSQKVTQVQYSGVVLGVRLPKMSRATAHTVSTVVVPMVPAGAV